MFALVAVTAAWAFFVLGSSAPYLASRLAAVRVNSREVRPLHQLQILNALGRGGVGGG